MSLLNSVIKAFVGDKSKRDVKELRPLVDDINAFGDQIQTLSNDELRAKTTSFKSLISETCASLTEEINKIKLEVEQSTDIDRNEELYAEIDKLEEEAYKLTQDTLDNILPEAFAVVKETARRFKDNDTLEVTATENDRILSGSKDYVSLEGDKAIWKNSWDAAGKEVTWDMVHYDVQLIGGIAL
ncbi:MAG: preprotein translocase subunit SecA, partial [Muriicola sp.]|nr:preprotein translocase subunit SecA [Muriicola sp.]NNK34747.1 preprotein translocase subunit SecA [Eudoraea sp.]